MKTRDAFWDLAKFFAILLVVFWHTIGESQMSFLQPFIKNFIVNMNMPLFFLISGYFSWDLVKGGDWRKLGKRVMGYFVPLFAFSMIQNSCECLFGLSGYVDSFPKEVLKGVLFNWWYIWVLAFCLVAVFACFRVRIYGRGRVIILLVLVFLGSLFIKHAWWVGSFRHMFPFFIFGLGCKWLNVEESLTVKVGLPCLLLFVLANIFEGTTYQSRLYWYGVDSSWWGLKTDGTAVWWELGHYALGVMGSVGVMWGIAALLKVVPRLANLAPLGETTLGVYLMHQWFLNRLSDWKLLSSNVLIVVVWTLVLFVVSHILTRLMTRNTWCRRIIWGKI